MGQPGLYRDYSKLNNGTLSYTHTHTHTYTNSSNHDYSNNSVKARTEVIDHLPTSIHGPMLISQHQGARTRKNNSSGLQKGGATEMTQQ